MLLEHSLPQFFKKVYITIRISRLITLILRGVIFSIIILLRYNTALGNIFQKKWSLSGHFGLMGSKTAFKRVKRFGFQEKDRSSIKNNVVLQNNVSLKFGKKREAAAMNYDTPYRRNLRIFDCIFHFL